MTQVLVAVLVGLSILVAILALRSMASARGRSRVRERLHELDDGSVEMVRESIIDVANHPVSPPLKLVALFGWLLPGLVSSESVYWDLARAGYRHSVARNVFAGAKVLLAVGLGLTAFALVTEFRLPVDKSIVITVISTVLGFFLPNIWIGHRERRRRQDIILTLPDALDLMVICVEAGQGLNAALVNVGTELREHARTLSQELRLINHEIRAGLSRSQGLRNLALRTGVEDIRALVAVLIQSDRLGSSIGTALRVHAQSLRIKRRQRAEEQARKTAVKLVFPLVFCIFPELLVVILAPGMIQLIRTLMSAG